MTFMNEILNFHFHRVIFVTEFDGRAIFNHLPPFLNLYYFSTNSSPNREPNLRNKQYQT